MLGVFIFCAGSLAVASRGDEAEVCGGVGGLLPAVRLAGDATVAWVRALRSAAAMEGPAGEGVLETAVDAEAARMRSRESRAVLSLTCNTNTCNKV